MKFRNCIKRILFGLVFILILWILLLRFPIYPVAKWMAKGEIIDVLKRQGLDPEKLGEVKAIEMYNVQWAFMADYNGDPPLRVGVRIGYDGSVEYFSEKKEE